MLRSRIINIWIKIFKNNFFLVISTICGYVLLSVSSGNLKFKHMEKRTANAFKTLLNLGLKFLGVFNSSSYVYFLNFQNVKKIQLYKIYKLFVSKVKICLIGFKIINKIPHNYSKK